MRKNPGRKKLEKLQSEFMEETFKKSCACWEVSGAIHEGITDRISEGILEDSQEEFLEESLKELLNNHCRNPNVKFMLEFLM